MLLFSDGYSTSYANLPVEEKRRLKEMADGQARESNMSVKDIIKVGSKIFDRIRQAGSVYCLVWVAY